MRRLPYGCYGHWPLPLLCNNNNKVITLVVIITYRHGVTLINIIVTHCHWHCLALALRWRHWLLLVITHYVVTPHYITIMKMALRHYNTLRHYHWPLASLAVNIRLEGHSWSLAASLVIGHWLVTGGWLAKSIPVGHWLLVIIIIVIIVTTLYWPLL